MNTQTNADDKIDESVDLLIMANEAGDEFESGFNLVTESDDQPKVVLVEDFPPPIKGKKARVM